MHLPGFIDSHTDQEDYELSIHFGGHAFSNDFRHIATSSRKLPAQPPFRQL
jgi:hypothetical protein